MDLKLPTLKFRRMLGDDDDDAQICRFVERVLNSP